MNKGIASSRVFTIIATDLSTFTNGDYKHEQKELIDALAAQTDSTKVDAERAVAALIDIISTTLKKGDSLSLVGFGTFEVRKRAARTGRNPRPVRN